MEHDPSPSHQRILYLDCLRVISIFAMMVLHVAAAQFGGSDVTSWTWMTANGYDSLVRFCVPVMVMVSGALYLSPTKKVTIKGMMTTAIPRILVAYLFWSFLYTICHFFLADTPYSVVDWVAYFCLGHYHLWFLFAVVGLYVATPLLRQIAANPTCLKYFLVCSFVFCYLINFLGKTDTWVGWLVVSMVDKTSLDFFWGYTGYFLLGHWLHHTNFKGGVRWVIYGLGVAGVLFTGVATYYTSINLGVADDRWYSYFLPTVALSATAVFVAVKELAQRVHWSPKGIQTLTTLSTLCFGMYLVHDFGNIALANLGITAASYPTILAVPCNALLVFLFSLCITWAMSKIPYLKATVR